MRSRYSDTLRAGRSGNRILVSGSSLHPSRSALGPTQAPVKLVSVIYSGVERLGRGVDHPPHIGPRLKKEKNNAYTSLLGHHGPVLGWALLLHV
jgi:hypothetical protein